MAICQCGCGETIEPGPKHKYRPPRFKPGHRQKQGTTTGTRRTKRYRMQEGGQACSCGCGTFIPELWPSGLPRYSNDGQFYARFHKPVQHQDHAKERLSSAGYILIYAPEHPCATKSGWIPEHRLIMIHTLKRPLSKVEHVHHINGVKTDNRPDNLIVLSRRDHMLIHGTNPNARATKEQLSQAGHKSQEVRKKLKEHTHT